MLIRPIKESERKPALEIVWSTFLRFEAPDYSAEGVQTFRAFIADEALFENLEFFGAFDGDTLQGMLATRSERGHIALFFVPAVFQRQGIGRALWQYILANSTASTITVNSSPYAVAVYQRFGFTATSAEQLTDGIRYTPMQFER